MKKQKKSAIIYFIVFTIILMGNMFIFSGCDNKTENEAIENSKEDDEKEDSKEEIQIDDPNNDSNKDNEATIKDITEADDDEKIETEEDEITAIARENIENKIAMAIDYVNMLDNTGSKESYPYEAEMREKRAYSTLSNDEKILYDELYEKIVNLEEFTYEVKNDESVNNSLFTVLWAIREDQPVTNFYFSPNYIWGDNYLDKLESAYILPSTAEYSGSEEIKKELAVFEKTVELIANGIDEEWSTENKYIYIAAVISLNVDYSYENMDFHPVYTGYCSIMGGKSQCVGYSLGFDMIAKEANLYSDLVHGGGKDEAHQWNLIRLDTGTYHADVTWADERGDVASDAWVSEIFMTQDKVLFDRFIYDETVATGIEISR